MRVGTLARLWFPLAVSFEMMMLEGPTVQGAMGRLPFPAANLAAWGLTMSLSLLVESPVIMLLATAIALVKDADSYRALRRFMLTLVVTCTVLTALVAFTPLFPWITQTLMSQPVAIAEAARPAMGIMLFWTAAIGWRRFYQGILVRHGQTRMVTWGTAIRLASTVSTAVLLARWGHLPGVQVGAVALMVAVITEALATTGFALPMVRRDVLTKTDTDVPLTQAAIFRFHTPLAATTLLTLLAQPMTAAALGKLPNRAETLAAFPVVYMVLLVMRGWGLALQEIAVAQARDEAAWPALRRFTWLVGGITSGVTVLIVCSPLLDLYLGQVIKLPPELWSYVHIGVGVGVLVPLLSALGSWVRGLLVVMGRTDIIYRGMGINLTTHATVLVVSVVLRLPAMWMASLSFSLAALLEYVYLARFLAVEHAAKTVAEVECSVGSAP